MKKFAPLAVLAAGTLWGFMGLFVRRLNAAGLSSIDVAQVRITTGLLVVGLYLLCTRRDRFRVRPRDLWCFFGTGIVSLLLFSFCYFKAMTYASLSVAAVLLYTAPMFVMLLSVLLFREKLTGKKILALLLAFFGCVLVSGLGSGAAVSTAGLLLGLGSGFFYALYSIFGRYAINRGYDSWTMTFYTFLFCAVGCVPFSNWGGIAATVSADRALLLWILTLGVVTAFLPYLLYSLGLQYMESSKASILASIEPVVGTLVGTFVFHEKITGMGVAGILLVLCSIAVLSAHVRKRRKI
ncbi:MAG: EamA family transporter [Oscillospiraceae bacterium]|nr:EamA family transporter [Oscillospiraceae bacterium]